MRIIDGAKTRRFAQLADMKTRIGIPRASVGRSRAALTDVAIRIESPSFLSGVAPGNHVHTRYRPSEAG